jgi:hypothetical protein
MSGLFRYLQKLGRKYISLAPAAPEVKVEIKIQQSEYVKRFVVN